MTDQPTRLFLVRHGETTANVEGRMQGRGNDHLTPLGEQQADAIAQRLRRESHSFDAIFTSPLWRAQQTAQVIGSALGLEPHIRDGLQEMNIGQLEGVSPAELIAAAPRDPDQPYPGGESGRQFVERVMGTLYGIVSAYSGGSVIAVSHGGVIATALSLWAGDAGNRWQVYAPPNCALSIIEFDHRPNIVLMNDCTHL